MTSKKSPAINVVRHGDGWAVRRDGAQRVTKTFDTQKEAIEHGRAERPRPLAGIRFLWS